MTDLVASGVKSTPIVGTPVISTPGGGVYYSTLLITWRAESKATIQAIEMVDIEKKFYTVSSIFTGSRE